jgi:hypothetical protein
LRVGSPRSPGLPDGTRPVPRRCRVGAGSAPRRRSAPPTLRGWHATLGGSGRRRDLAMRECSGDDLPIADLRRRGRHRSRTCWRLTGTPRPSATRGSRAGSTDVIIFAPRGVTSSTILHHRTLPMSRSLLGSIVAFHVRTAPVTSGVTRFSEGRNVTGITMVNARGVPIAA